MSLPISYLEQLRVDLDEIDVALKEMLDGSTIRYVNPNTPSSDLFIVDAADWGWGRDDDATSARAMRLIRSYGEWFERFSLLFPHPTPKISDEIRGADELVRRWIQRDDTFDHTIPQTIDAAKKIASAQLETYRRLIDLVGADADPIPRVVPDTNSLLKKPDLRDYEQLVPGNLSELVLLPTVLGELDDLKDRGKAQDIREKAQKAANIIKGLTDRGPLFRGVTVTQNLRAVAPAREIDVKSVFDWLDPSVPDDRILAASLRLQAEQPSALVVLVTGDINLRNKAAAVGLPTIPVPH